MKKIMIFGATGTVGLYTAIELKDSGYEVIAVGRRKDSNHFFQKNGIEYFSLDIADKNSFSLLPTNDIDCVIHLAGAMPAHMEGYVPDDYFNSIIHGTFHILEFIRNNDIHKIVFGHSISDILYQFGELQPIAPDIEMKFPTTGDHSIYSICKNAAVNLINHYYHQYGISRYILRMPTIYAYHPNPFYYVDGKKKKMGFRTIIDNAIRAKQIEIWGNPERSKEIVYVKDYISMIVGAIESSCNGGVYNAGTGIGVSLETQVREVINIFSPEGDKSSVIYKKDAPDAPQFILDISNAIKDLNYKPLYDYVAYLKDFKHEMELQRFSELWGHEADYH